MLWMKKNAYEESTIKATAKRLRHLERNCDLSNPEEVKLFIANKKCTNGFKETLIEVYAIYMRSIGQTWNQPFYNRYDRAIKIPTEEKVNMLISNASPKMALILAMSKDLGTRPIELTWLTVSDINMQNRTVSIMGAKHTAGGTGKIKEATLDMLKHYINEKHLNANDRLFPVMSKTLSEEYRTMRNRLAKKLQDPTFKTIRLYDFRHFKASVIYHQTNSFMHVKEILRHKDLRTTMRYIHLFGNMEGDEFHCSVAKNIQEATNLIENGFEYVTEMDGLKLFRKRK
jgi:integrase